MANKRRANGEGSWWQLPDRTWVHQITIGRKENGSPERKSFKGKIKGDLQAEKGRVACGTGTHEGFGGGFKTRGCPKGRNAKTPWAFNGVGSAIQGCFYGLAPSLQVPAEPESHRPTQAI